MCEVVRMGSQMRGQIRRIAFLQVLFVGVVIALPSVPALGQVGEWPMLAHDCARSGTTATEIRPPFDRKWYRLFPDEGLMAGVQPVIAGGKVFVGTMRGVLHAVDCDTGADVWTYRSQGAILHACAVGGGKVVFGDAAGRICAVNVVDGTPAWSVQTGAAVWNAPLIHENTVVIGGRDGYLYAIDLEKGTVRWKARVGGPLLSSPALDARRDRVYVADERMHLSAFHLGDGRLMWQSAKLPGVSFRGYHPVVAPDGSVMVTTSPAISLDSFEPILMDMVKDIFGDFASWRHKKDENDCLREANFKKMAEPGAYEAQLNYIRKRLTDDRTYQTFFVLDPNTGRQKFVAPIVYAESMNGTGAPPIVTADGKVTVKYRALLRSRYEHYSPFLNVGYLDTATGYIAPIMDQSRTYGWYDSLLLVHDEQCQLSAAGRVLINTHQDNVNAMNLDTLQGYGRPFCRGMHEPKPGEAVAILATALRGGTLPPGKEWLARGTAVYGGGSVIDTAVSIAGDSFYFIPTHELNAGVAVVAYRMSADGKASQESQPPSGGLSDEQWRRVRGSLDWDTLQSPRLTSVLASLPGKAPTTLEQIEPESLVSDDDLDRIIWQARAVPAADGADRAQLKSRLEEAMRELVSQIWQPLVFPPGKHPRESYRIFADPTETLLTLALAYPHVDEDLQEQIRRYVDRLGPEVNKPVVEPCAGATRSYYDIDSDKLFRLMDDITRSDVARLYPIWLWAHTTDDWRYVERHWEQFRSLLEQPANRMEEDCRNGYVAGLIAWCRMAEHMKDQEAVARGVLVARKAMRERLQYEFAHPNDGVIGMVPTSRSIFSRWRHLTPEVGRLLACGAGRVQRHLMDVYVDYHRPTWDLAWGVETMWRNESPFAFPTMSAEIFAARAWILGEPAEDLARHLDIPWCRADLFHIQKLVLCIEAQGAIAGAE